ncbi:Concanavalin A-like lectin/glucanase [Cordyceps fumosorosea ARSEF 2679]|uniref:Concanavalin A-like lectin/glucanase n=1 Tax=Cordyceps fumosorosea (strain ARSEF 2679) TaxID=1081104 RepID=A0A167S8X1_CORFA|nr:Concanavalin A-like lectin/glucanase [Cordyceps fumosorosea ARSEF 2679]OAA59377.1 Concanavalin A-like lectin/glucanase [Cordyceps fumosorosea ARSEF 2679]
MRQSHGGIGLQASLVLLILVWLGNVSATAPAPACSCGYQVGGANGESWLFTEVIETDFTRVKSIAAATDWRRQEFNVSAEAGRGKYSKYFTPKNVAIGPGGATQGASGKQAGVELSVGATIVNGAVPVAEMDTARQDLLWGSFRAGMKLTPVQGTCAAFFWYFNDTQEIDMEFLSMQYNRENNTFPVNLVIQSKESAARGYDASGTSTYKTINLGFDPSASFHEYRFDYVPGKVYFYADSKLLAEMEGTQIPDSAGHLILQHWSNGNAKWSGGPPKEDASIVVSYVKAYFNSSDAERESKWQTGCGPGRVAACLVPNGTADNATDGGQFLNPNHTQGNGDESLAPVMLPKLVSLLMLLIGMMLIWAD